MSLAVPAAAHASGIGTHGPVTEAYGWFPEWYEDAAGTRLELCVDGPYCMATMEAPLPHPDEPARFPDNFPDEAFWWAGETTLTYPGGAALLVLAQEAAFANGPIEAGQQVAFGRVRIRATGLVPNAWYRFTYPYGQIDLQAIDKAPRVVNHTSDVGCMAAPCADAFGQLEGSAIGPEFLQWDATESAPPEGYIGNPGVAHRITGSRFVPEGETEPANYFRIDRITGPGGTLTSTVGRTDSFLLQGKLAGPPRGHFAAKPVHFDGLEVGSSDERTVTIRNTGSGSLPLGATRIAGEDQDDFWVSGGTCELPRTLAPGETCVVRVGFAPTQSGDRSARLDLPGGGEDGTTVHSIALSGIATPRPVAVTSVPDPVPAPLPAPSAPAPAGGPAVLVPGAGAAVLGEATRSLPAVRSLTVRSVLARARVRVEGMRAVLRIAGDADVVRVRIYRTRGARRSLVYQALRSPTSNPVRLRLSGRGLRHRLTPGRYRIEVAAGPRRDTLGAVEARTFRVR